MHVSIQGSCNFEQFDESKLYNTDKFNVDHVNNIHKLTRVGNILRETFHFARCLATS